MQTSIVFGHIKRLPGLNSRPRSSTSYLPQGTTCLEERLLLSGTAPSVSRTALAVRTALAQGPTAVPSIVKAQPDQIVYRNITYTEANGQPERKASRSRRTGLSVVDKRELASSQISAV